MKEENLTDHTLYDSDYKAFYKRKNYKVIKKKKSMVAKGYREGSGNPLQCSCLENPWTEKPDRL